MESTGAIGCTFASSDFVHSLEVGTDFRIPSDDVASGTSVPVDLLALTNTLAKTLVGDVSGHYVSASFNSIESACAARLAFQGLLEHVRDALENRLPANGHVAA